MVWPFSAGKTLKLSDDTEHATAPKGAFLWVLDRITCMSNGAGN